MIFFVNIFYNDCFNFKYNFVSRFESSTQKYVYICAHSSVKCFLYLSTFVSVCFFESIAGGAYVGGPGMLTRKCQSRDLQTSLRNRVAIVSILYAFVTSKLKRKSKRDHHLRYARRQVTLPVSNRPDFLRVEQRTQLILSCTLRPKPVHSTS